MDERDGELLVAKKHLSDAHALARDGKVALAESKVLVALFQLRASAPSPAQQELLVKAMLLRLRCLGREERFEKMIGGCGELLAMLPPETANGARADCMVLLAFAQMELCNPEGAMRASFLALQDSLALDDRDLIAQALDCVAQCYMKMGDIVSAERFMLESVGYAQQANDTDMLLTRLSNAVYLTCSLFDTLTAAGDTTGATLLIKRSLRLNNLGETVVHVAENQFTVQMWRANQTVWLRRANQPERAGVLLDEVLQVATRQSMHAIRRPLNLERAATLAQEGRLQEAIAELEAMFMPRHVPVRDTQAMLAYGRLERLHQALGMSEQAARSRSMYETLMQRCATSVARLQQTLPALSSQIEEALAETERLRLQAELERLREQHLAGRDLSSTAMAWQPQNQSVS